VRVWARRAAIVAAGAAGHYAGYLLCGLFTTPGMSWAASLAWTAGAALLVWALARSSWPLRAGLVVSAACLFYFFRGVRLGDMGQAALQIRAGWLAPALLMGFVLYALKSYRWQLLLAPVAKAGFWRLMRASLMGFMANCILPGRVGEVVRPAMVAAGGGVRFTSALATTVVERVFDLAGVVFYLALSLFLLRAPLSRPEIAGVMQWVWAGSAAITAVTLAACGFLVLMKLFPRRIVAWSEGLTRLGVAWAVAAARLALRLAPASARSRALDRLGRLGQALDERLLHILESFAEGLQVIRGVGQAVWLFVLSLAHWGAGILLIYFVTLSFPTLGLGVLGSALGFSFSALAVAAPSTPGFLGPFQVAMDAACRAVMVPAAYAGQEAVVKSFIMLLWFVNNVPVVLGGFVSLWFEGLTLGDLKRQGQKPSAPGEGRV